MNEFNILCFFSDSAAESASKCCAFSAGGVAHQVKIATNKGTKHPSTKTSYNVR